MDYTFSIIHPEGVRPKQAQKNYYWTGYFLADGGGGTSKLDRPIDSQFMGCAQPSVGVAVPGRTARAESLLRSGVSCLQARKPALKEADRLLRMASSLGSFRAKLLRGILWALFFGKGKRYASRGRRVLRQAACQGCADAAHLLGIIYSYGFNTRSSDYHAARWFLLASKLGHPLAQYYLGHAYFFGQGVERNLRKAKVLLALSAEQGVPEAQAELGGLLVDSATASNRKKGIKFLRLAANAGVPGAQNDLGTASWEGCGTRASMEDAVRWWRIAVKSGSLVARYNLGLSCLEGRGCRRSISLGLRLLEEARRAGYRPAEKALKKWNGQ